MFQFFQKYLPMRCQPRRAGEHAALDLPTAGIDLCSNAQLCTGSPAPEAAASLAQPGTQNRRRAASQLTERLSRSTNRDRTGDLRTAAIRLGRSERSGSTCVRSVRKSARQPASGKASSPQRSPFVPRGPRDRETAKVPSRKRLFSSRETECPRNGMPAKHNGGPQDCHTFQEKAHM